MAAPTLSELVTPATVSDVLGIELTVANVLGLPTTAWQPLGMARTILAVNANVASTYSNTVAFMAQGGYASYAAQMVDGNGNPVTTWMDLIGVENYNVTRIPATAAAGRVKVTNTSSNAYPYIAGSLHFAHPTSGATYTNTAAGTIAANTANQSIDIVADQPGSASNAAPGVVLTMVTPLLGVTVVPLVTALLGTDAETNQAYYQRCIAKLGTLSPNGPSQAYYYVATSRPVFGVTQPDGTVITAPSQQYPYDVVSPVTRVTTSANTSTGTVLVYCANADGALTGCADAVISAITNTSNPQITTVGAHGLAAGDWVIIQGVNGATGINNSLTGTVAWQVASIVDTFNFTVTAGAPGIYTSGGTVNGADLGMVNLAIQTQVVPNAVTATVSSAQTHAIAITYTVYIPTAAGVQTTVLTNAIADALAVYFESIPIGGVTDASVHVVPIGGIQGTIFSAAVAQAPTFAARISVTVSAPSGDVTLAANEVPVISGSPTATVVFT